MAVQRIECTGAYERFDDAAIDDAFVDPVTKIE
jgi:hypothetical protein